MSKTVVCTSIIVVYCVGLFSFSLCTFHLYNLAIRHGPSKMLTRQVQIMHVVHTIQNHTSSTKATAGPHKKSRTNPTGH